MLQLSEKSIRNIKITFNTVFISIIAFSVLRRLFLSLPHDFLFFFTSDAIENLLCVIIVYTLFFKILKLNDIWRKIGFSFLCILPLMVLAVLKSYRALHVLEFERSFEFFTNFLGRSFLFYLLVYFFNKIELFNHYLRLETELKQAKEQLLKNQLHPHFLFNAFNSLYSMALSHNPKTPDTILKLSGMMRYLTDDSVSQKVKLSQELTFIKEYISIEKIRFGEQANICLQINGNPEGKNIEPLLLMALVENAFKHGFYTNDASSFVNIDVEITGHMLHFTAKNSVQKKQHFNKANRKGVGLENLKKRLQLSYPKTSWHSAQKENNVYTAQLKINLK